MRYAEDIVVLTRDADTAYEALRQIRQWMEVAGADTPSAENAHRGHKRGESELRLPRLPLAAIGLGESGQADPPQKLAAIVGSSASDP